MRAIPLAPRTLRAFTVLVLTACSALCTHALRAQSTEFALSTGSVVFPMPRQSNYTTWPASATGPVTDSVSVPFTVSALQQSTLRTTTVLIRCLAVAGPKQCTDIEWRFGSNGPWRALTQTDAEVESRTVIPFIFNDPWSGTLWLRVRIGWTDPAPSLVTSNIAMTLSVYRP